MANLRLQGVRNDTGKQDLLNYSIPDDLGLAGQALVSTGTQMSFSTVLTPAGGTLTGFLTLHADPTDDLHAATKQYVDNNSGGSLPDIQELDVQIIGGYNIQIDEFSNKIDIPVNSYDKVIKFQGIAYRQNQSWGIFLSIDESISSFNIHETTYPSSGTPSTTNLSGSFSGYNSAATYSSTEYLYFGSPSESSSTTSTHTGEIRFYYRNYPEDVVIHYKVESYNGSAKTVREARFFASLTANISIDGGFIDRNGQPKYNLKVWLTDINA